MEHIITANRAGEPPLVLVVKSDLPADEIENAVRAAVSDFVNSGTNAARNALSATSGQFNWGDAALWLPDEYAAPHGFHVTGAAVSDLVVDHDDSLLPQGQADA